MKKVNTKATPFADKKPGNLKKGLIPGSVVLIGILVVTVILNFSRLEYMFGKKDPVAVVHNEPIFMKQFEAYFIKAAADFQNMSGGQSILSSLANDDSTLKSFQNDLLDTMIDGNVQIIEAKKYGIKLTNKDVENANKAYITNLNNIHVNLGDSFNFMLANVNLAEPNLNNEIKRESLNNEIINKLRQKEFNSYKLTIPQNDLESVYVRGIIMPLGTSSDVKVKKAAEDALAMLKSGAKFDDVVKKYSKYTLKNSSNSSTDVLGWISRRDVPKDFADKIFAVQAGHFTDVVENKSACSIVLVDKKKKMDINNLTSDETQSLMNSDGFKNYYTNMVKKWRKELGAYKYITSFKLNIVK